MAQQTVVQWISDNLIGNPYTEEDFAHNVSIFKQAKEMEKEQITNTYLNACARVTPYGYYNDSAEQYYNETYGSNNQI